MTEEGFQIDDYMLHIKQLRMNYTSYNVDSRSPEEKQEVYDAIKKFGGRNPRNFDLIRVYEWAANKCKNRRDPEGDTYVRSSIEILFFKIVSFYLVVKHHGLLRVA